MITRRQIVAGGLATLAATASGNGGEAPSSLSGTLDAVLTGDLPEGADRLAQVERAMDREEARFLDAARKLWHAGPKNEQDELRLLCIIDVLGRIGGSAAAGLLSAHLRYAPEFLLTEDTRTPALPECFPCAYALSRIGIPSLPYLVGTITHEKNESDRIVACSTLRLIAKTACAGKEADDGPPGAALAKAFIAAIARPVDDAGKQRVAAAMAFLSLPRAEMYAAERRERPR